MILGRNRRAGETLFVSQYIIVQVALLSASPLASEAAPGLTYVL
jgi:hypothetical protein